MVQPMNLKELIFPEFCRGQTHFGSRFMLHTDIMYIRCCTVDTDPKDSPKQPTQTIQTTKQHLIPIPYHSPTSSPTHNHTTPRVQHNPPCRLLSRFNKLFPGILFVKWHETMTRKSCKHSHL